MNPTIEQLVDRALDTLAEHCDSVRIFVTWDNDEKLTNGRGNLSAQIQEARSWVRLMDKEEERAFESRGASGLVKSLKRIVEYPVHSEPVGGALDMQEIARDALKAFDAEGKD